MASIKGNLNLQVVGEDMERGARKGLRIATEHILQVSNTRVPNEEGDLERSGRASVDDAALRGAVAYDTEYAVVQHERLDYRHSGGREAKYLERAMTGEARTVKEIVATSIRRELR